jgi:hypothetical protein
MHQALRYDIYPDYRYLLFAEVHVQAETQEAARHWATCAHRCSKRGEFASEDVRLREKAMICKQSRIDGIPFDRLMNGGQVLNLVVPLNIN